MSDLEVRQLRYFVAVAEELHFGRAAARLNMAQPPLSRAIRELEHQLGVTLLERTTRQVALTPAGEVFLHDARIALDAVAAAGRRVTAAGKLRLAMKADYDAGLLPKILATYQEDAAALPVDLTLGGRGEQAPALRDGRADVAILPQPFDDRGLDSEPLVVEPRLVALAADDPLAARSSLRLSDLAGRLLPDGRRADREELPPAPGAGRTGLDLAQIFNLVELGTIVWYAPQSLARLHRRPGIAYRPVPELTASTLVVAWSSGSHSPAVAAFVRAATAVSGSYSTRRPAPAESASHPHMP